MACFMAVPGMLFTGLPLGLDKSQPQASSSTLLHVWHPVVCDVKVNDPAAAGIARRHRMRIAYDGTNYCGWQAKQSTVQGEIEKQIRRKTGHLIRVVGASRTDSGVHARGQTAHFDVPDAVQLSDLQSFEYTLNQMLPPDIRVRDVSLAPPPKQRTAIYPPSSVTSPIASSRTHLPPRPWHAIYDARSKLYTYRISTTAPFDPLDRMYRHHEWRGCILTSLPSPTSTPSAHSKRAPNRAFDAAAFASAVRAFQGTHDFSAFTNMDPAARVAPAQVPQRTYVRSVVRADVVDEGDGKLRAEFVLTGALYRMVRNMVGAALDVGCGALDVDGLHEVMEMKDRRLAPKGAPAKGLCLEEVYYDE